MQQLQSIAADCSQVGERCIMLAVLAAGIRCIHCTLLAMNTLKGVFHLEFALQTLLTLSIMTQI